MAVMETGSFVSKSSSPGSSKRSDGIENSSSVELRLMTIGTHYRRRRSLTKDSESGL